MPIIQTGSVKKTGVSHGSGKAPNGMKYGDSEHNGYVKQCTHPSGHKVAHSRQNMTRVGFFKTLSFGNSLNHGPKQWPTILKKNKKTYDHMKLDGLTPGVNDDAKGNHVYMHEATYNKGFLMGRSFGCPAFRPGEGRKIMRKIHSGSLYYGYLGTNVCQKEMRKVLKQVPNWQNKCE